MNKKATPPLAALLFSRESGNWMPAFAGLPVLPTDVGGKQAGMTGGLVACLFHFPHFFLSFP